VVGHKFVTGVEEVVDRCADVPILGFSGQLPTSTQAEEGIGFQTGIVGINCVGPSVYHPQAKVNIPLGPHDSKGS
jgi:hypothetical protein